LVCPPRKGVSCKNPLGLAGRCPWLGRGPSGLQVLWSLADRSARFRSLRPCTSCAGKDLLNFRDCFIV